MVHRYELAIIGHGLAVLSYAVINAVRTGIGIAELVIAGGGIALVANQVHKSTTDRGNETYSQSRTRVATVSFVLVLLGTILSLAAPVV